MKFLKLLLVAIPLALLILAGCAGNNEITTRNRTTRNNPTIYPRINQPEPENTSVQPLPRPTPRPRRGIPFRRLRRQPVNETLIAETPAVELPEANASTAESMLTTSQPLVTLAQHQTDFDIKDEGRSHNITLAASAINDHTVLPGEIFSYNETVGPTIPRRGYKKGVIFIKGEKSKGYGGGVCQVSTTLYNAAEAAGLTIIERHDHSLPVSYAETGKDAATSYGGIDFKFKNDTPYPITIYSHTENGTVFVKIISA